MIDGDNPTDKFCLLNSESNRMFIQLKTAIKFEAQDGNTTEVNSETKDIKKPHQCRASSLSLLMQTF
ncbi:hypothetical protein AY606_14670 [Acinetobacter sp. SFB]|nr:hypothetical protein AY606_14670 [Acinetobacter sp. SFB]